MLTVNNLNVYYGTIHAIHDISLQVNEGEIVSLIGANGAGKTTILHTITGLVKAESGEILLEGKDLRKTDPYKILGLGMAHVPEGRHIFSSLTVEENLEMGAFIRKDSQGIAADIEDVFKRFPRLRERAKQRGGTLSGGEQQMLAIGRAIMSKPRILLLDEPVSGLDPLVTSELYSLISHINSEMKITIVMVTHDISSAIKYCGKVLHLGKKQLFFGSSEEYMKSEPGQRFLGGAQDD